MNSMTWTYRALSGHPAKCDLEVLRHQEFVLVIASERSDNPGTSITNWAERLAGEVSHVLDIPPKSLVWIEHYPERGDAFHPMPEDWDLVTFQWRDGRKSPFSHPRWWRLNRDQLQALRSGAWPDLPAGLSARAVREEVG